MIFIDFLKNQWSLSPIRELFADDEEPLQLAVTEGRNVFCTPSRSAPENYRLVNKHSYGKWPFIVDFTIKNGDFP